MQGTYTGLLERAFGQLLALAVLVIALLGLNGLHAHTVIGMYVPFASLMLVAGGVVGLVLRRLPLQPPPGDTFWLWSFIVFGMGSGAVSLLQLAGAL